MGRSRPATVANKDFQSLSALRKEVAARLKRLDRPKGLKVDSTPADYDFLLAVMHRHRDAAMNLANVEHIELKLDLKGKMCVYLHYVGDDIDRLGHYLSTNQECIDGREKNVNYGSGLMRHVDTALPLFQDE